MAVVGTAGRGIIIYQLDGQPREYKKVASTSSCSCTSTCFCSSTHYTCSSTCTCTSRWRAP